MTNSSGRPWGHTGCSASLPLKLVFPKEQSSPLHQWTAQGSQRPRAGDYGVRSEVPLLLYADDIVLLAASGESCIQCLMWSRFTRSSGGLIRTTAKSNVVVLGSRSQKLQAVGTWDDASLLAVLDEYKYLGSGKASGSAGRWNSLLGSLHAKAKQSLACLSYQCGGSDGLRPLTAIGH
jgi:hypothetical protein